MTIDKKQIQHLAKLCRIKCTDEQIKNLENNLSSILSYVQQLNEIDTTDTPTCHHVLESIVNVTREDEVANQEELLDHKTFLDNSPSSIAGMIRVPPTLT